MMDESDHYEEPTKVWLSECCDAEPLELTWQDNGTAICSRCKDWAGFSEAWDDGYGKVLKEAS